jgi:low affinity Fe/Cu permease
VDPVEQDGSRLPESVIDSSWGDLPSGVSADVGVFDRFAGHASRIASRAPFFAFCVLLVVIWAPTIFVLRDIDTWQLIINTITTIVTFLLVALLQNTQYRTDAATQHKLNAIAEGSPP